MASLRRITCAAILCLFHLTEFTFGNPSELSVDPVFIELTVDFFVVKKQSQGLAFTCWGHGNHELLKRASDVNLQLKVWDPNKRLRDIESITQTENRLSLMIDLSCRRSSRIIEKAFNKLKFGKSFHWLFIWSQAPPTLRPEDEEVHLPYELSSYFYLMLHSDGNFAVRFSNDTFAIVDAYKIWYWPPYNAFNFTVLGTWEAGSIGLSSILPTDYIYKRRGNLHGVPLRTAMAPFYSTYNFSSVYEKTGFPTHDANAALLIILTELFNFTADLIVSEFGLPTLFGWRGMIGLVQQNEVDLAATVISQLPAVGLVADFVHSIVDFRPTVFFMQPPIAAVRNVFALPFKLEVWIALVISIILVIILLQISILFLEPRDKPWDRGEVVLLTLGAVCQQGAPRLPLINSARIAILWYLFPLVLLYCVYAGGVISLLSTRDRSITTIKGLIENKFYVVTDEYPYINLYFEQTKNPDGLRLSNVRAKTSDREDAGYVKFNALDGILNVKRGFYAFCSEIIATDIHIYNHYTETESCNLDAIALPASKVKLAMTVVLHSPYLELFNWGTIKMYDFGILNYIISHLDMMKPECSKSKFVSLELTGLAPAFFLLGAGVVSSVCILLLEILVHKRKRLGNGTCPGKGTMKFDPKLRVTSELNHKETSNPAVRDTKFEPHSALPYLP